MNVNEACQALGVSDENYVYRLLRSGRLSGHKVNGVWKVDPDSVELRRHRIAHKRSAAATAADDRQRRRVEAAARYAV